MHGGSVPDIIMLFSKNPVILGSWQILSEIVPDNLLFVMESC